VKIFSAEQFKQWDLATIAGEPVASIDLMERAANKCCDWLVSKGFDFKNIKIFCGKGNNGGDGLAIARILQEKGSQVHVWIVETGSQETGDFRNNFARLGTIPVNAISNETDFPPILPGDLVVDAIFGTGLNKPIQGVAAAFISYLNHQPATLVSVDLPSGMYADRSSANNAVVHASYTLTFGGLKTAMLVSDEGIHCGEIVVLDIGLDRQFYNNTLSRFLLSDASDMRSIYRPRNRFSHKGNFGHAFIAAGSHGKMGAALLSASACMHAGCGMVTCYIPAGGYSIMQTALPEAMCITDEDENFLSQPVKEQEKFNAIGVGPGIGKDKKTAGFLRKLMKRSKIPLVLDADALNILADDASLFEILPQGSIITPHPKEFDRLFGEHEDNFARIETAIDRAVKHNIVIVLKGHHTLITYKGNSFFNNTGNAGMAKAGSGDVLTGIITSLVAQGYFPEQAAQLGCFLHGMAGDHAAADLTQECMTASDIVHYLPRAFTYLSGKS
jgi:ADP-dependent NAD(P)H-hydrate dehydratase / NAD(P)H-hydrate epimerase